MWKRFSFYGMRALLILFMTAGVADGGLGYEVATAGAVYALHTSLVYLMGLPGGWIADRLIGQRRAVLVGGFEFPASWFQWVPALFVIIQAPIIAWLWVRLGRHQPSSPAKFSLGLTFVGLGLIVMVAASELASRGASVGPGWLLATHFLHVVGAMCLSPVGLSTVTKLAPARVAGLMMGVWFLASAVGNYLGGRVAGLYGTMPLPELCGLVAATTIAGGLGLALISRPIRRLMGGVR